MTPAHTVNPHETIKRGNILKEADLAVSPRLAMNKNTGSEPGIVTENTVGVVDSTAAVTDADVTVGPVGVTENCRIEYPLRLALYVSTLEMLVSGRPVRAARADSTMLAGN